MSLLENQARTIFLAALEQAPDQWSALLDQACGDNAALRVRVDELLHAHRALGSIPDGGGTNVETLTIEQPIREGPGSVIGHYKLLERIGEGGFGIVFVAEQQQPIRRKVALKVLKAGMDTRHIVARFEAERQALAIMDHPNIARVFDGGATPGGRPYFVMELVKGVPITEFCDENHLTPRQRLELFLTVCQAVQHAHQKGIIHRDLKPSNVLVSCHDTTPTVKVIDFGVAKALGQALTDKTLFTGVAQMIGTPLYMSPEQAGMSELDVDTRSDIYSLGVLLYELLTGTTPFSKERFRKAAYDEIRRIICEEEPPKPSTRLSESTETLPSVSAQRHMEPAKLTKLVRGDLDWIVMKALEKDRNRRYETANGFAADVQRYLNDEPVLACPPSRWYRLRKFARRNKVALTMTASLGVALLAGVMISTWQAVRASRAEQVALVNFERARGAVKRMLTRVAQEELVDVPWMEPVRKALLEDALQFYEQLLAERTADPEVRFATAQARLDLAWINGRYGEAAQQEAGIRLALELLEPLAEEFPENLRYCAGLASALHHQSHLTAWTPKRWKEAEQLLLRAIKLQESVVSATPDSVENAYDLANMLHLLGNALRTGGRVEEAETVYWRVVSIGEGFTAKDPNHPAHLRAQIRGLTSIADMVRQKEPDRAEPLLLRAQGLAGRFQAARRKTGFLFDTAAATVANVDEVWGGLYKETGRPKEAEAAFRRAVAVYAKYATDFPDFRFYRERLAWATESLAGSLADPADREEAERIHREVIEKYEKLVADFPKASNYRPGLARSYRALAALLDATSRPEAADNARRQALAHFLKVTEDDPDNIDSRISSAWLCNQLAKRAQRPEEAEQQYRQTLTLFQSLADDYPTVPKYRSNLGDTYGRLATLFWDAGKLQESETAARQSLAVFDKLVTDFPAQAAYRQALANTYQWQLARIFVATRRPKEAEEARRQVLAIWQKLAADFPRESQYWHKLGVIQHGLVQYDEAVTSLTRAVDLQPDLWESWHWRGIAFGSLAQWDEAVADQTKAIELNPDHPWSWHQRGLGHSRLAQWEEAIADHTKAIELKPDYWEAYHARGWSLARLGKWDKAIADQTKALELNPKHWWTWSRRGEGYSALKQWDNAVADYTKAIELGPAEPYVWVSRAAAHAQLDQPEKAIADLRQAVAKGFRDVKQLKNRSDLAGLRLREDFKEMLTELEAKKK
jgi:serine/threonine protein kinase/tetratricopeptide (TPR) repeat protein